MIASEMYPHIYGTTIHVKTVPGYFYNFLRDNHVALLYDFSTVESIPGGKELVRVKENQTVYVLLEQDGEFWKAVGVSLTQPKEGVYLRGVRKPYRSGYIEYGIESYYVQEGKGKEFEDVYGPRWRWYYADSVPALMTVELVVAPNGKAAIKDVRIKKGEPNREPATVPPTVPELDDEE
jgi:uncharacterized membrane-anchored protein